MSCFAYTGRPGSGKSYNVVANVVIKALSKGRTVAHNLILNPVELARHTKGQGRLIQIPHDATAADVIKICPRGAVVILDEAWQWWPAGLKTSSVPSDQLEFFKQHRHRVDQEGNASEIILIDQDLGSGICKFLRDLVDVTYVHTKLETVKMSNRYRVDMYRDAVPASQPVKSKHIRTMFGTYKPEIFACYKSHTQSDSDYSGGLEEMPDGRANVFGSFSVKAAAVSLLLMPLVFWFAFSSFKNIADGPAQLEAVAASSEQSEVNPLPRTASAIPERFKVNMPLPNTEPVPEVAAVVDEVDQAQNRTLQISPHWRVQGSVWRADGTGRVLVASATGKRFLDADQCGQDHAGNWSCELDGYLATEWSGARLATMASAAVAPGVLANHQNIQRTGG